MRNWERKLAPSKFNTFVYTSLLSKTNYNDNNKKLIIKKINNNKNFKK